MSSAEAVSRPSGVGTGVSLPPSPSLSKMMQAMGFGRDPFGFLDRARAECGDTFSLYFPGDMPRVVTGDPAHIRTIFALPADAYQMADQAIPLNLGDASLLFLDGEKHREQHRLLMPPLHGKHLKSYETIIERATNIAIDRWPLGTPFSLLEEMQWITLTAIFECVLGVHEGAQIERLRHIITYWLTGPMSPLGFTLGMMIGAGRVRRFLDRQVATSPIRHPNPTGKRRLFKWQRLGDAKAELMSMLHHELECCRKAGRGERTDVLAMLSETRDEAGNLMPAAEVVDQLVTLLVGGYETTANALCWAVHHILAAPDALEKLRVELTEAAGDPEAKTPWLAACIKEALRLKPIAPVVNRRLVRPLTLGQYTIPKDTILWPSMYLTHTNPVLWESPHVFKPDRFLDQSPRANEWLAFGGGQRRCIGAAFAEFEMKVILAKVFARVSMRAADDASSYPIMRGITVSPRDHLRVVVSDRNIAQP